jgi:hypothetical protein
MEDSGALKVLKRWVEPMRPRLRPTFLIIGAQKAGTSALFSILAESPKVLAPGVKELHFFDDDAAYAQGVDAYWKRFPLVPLRRPGLLTFEATPCYLFFPLVSERLYAALPDARLVVVLRDPVKRAYSAWNMRRQFKDHPRYAHRYEPRSFEEAIADELRNGALSAPLNDYLARGAYAEQLERFFKVYPREQVLVINYRDLKTEQLNVVNQVCAFVGLPALRGDERALTGRYNERPYSERMSEEMAEELYRYFVPHQHRLDQLLGRPMDLVEDRTRTTLYQ